MAQGHRINGGATDEEQCFVWERGALDGADCDLTVILHAQE